MKTEYARSCGTAVAADAKRMRAHISGGSMTTRRLVVFREDEGEKEKEKSRSSQTEEACCHPLHMGPWAHVGGR